MGRLIDAENLKKAIADLVVGGEEHINEAGEGNSWINGIHSAYREIDNTPTVEFEVAEKFYFDQGYKQGYTDARNDVTTDEWIQKCDDNFDWYECSCCGYGNEGELQERPWYKYCPVCGATMKGSDK